MTHLSADQLSALADGVLSGRAREDLERHLAGCASCQEALSGLVAQDQALAHALSHDPGESYFETFPSRVTERIRAASPVGARSRLEDSRGLADWFRSPRKLGWLGAVAAVVATAGIVLMSSREIKRTDLRDAGLANRSNQVAEPTPTSPSAEGARNAAPPQRASELRAERQAKDPIASRDEAAAPSVAPSPSTGATAPQSRLREVRRNAAGEDVPVGREQGPAFATPPPVAQSSPASNTGSVRVIKQRVAQPLAAGAPNQESAEALAKKEGARPTEEKSSAMSSRGGASSTAPGAHMLSDAGTTAAEQQLDASIGASAFETLPSYARSIARNAQRLTAVAERLDAASGYDAAASEWSRLLGHVKGGALEQETRWQIASARFHAFQASRNGPRRTRAADALRAFLATAAPGERHDEAVRWLDQVNRAK